MALAGVGFANRSRSKGILIGPLLLLTLLIMQAACGGGGSSTSPPISGGGGTPAGTYTINVTAKSASIQHSINVMLRVQ